MSPTRKVFSFCCAVALLCGSLYAMYLMFTASVSAEDWWIVGTGMFGMGMFAFVALWWIWEDFIKKETPTKS